MSVVLDSGSVDETRLYGNQLARLLRANDVVLLSGDLGAGKTEFAQGVAEGLNISEAVNSPTFNLLLIHPIPENEAAKDTQSETITPDNTASAQSNQLARPHSLYHFDLYRLDYSDELETIDYFGMLEDGAVSLVEWGDRFQDALPEDYLLIIISQVSSEKRTLEFLAEGKRSSELLAQWQQLVASMEPQMAHTDKL